MKPTIQSLLKSIKNHIPDVSARLDAPVDPKGHWFLDLELQGHQVVVEWLPKNGFGVSSATENEYGEGPEEVFSNTEDATLRIVQLLRARTHTSPPETVILRELRQLSKLTQEEIAKRLGIAQGAVSRMERRRDMSISTLRRLIVAMGGELDLVARFPGKTVHIGQFEEEQDGAYDKAACLHAAAEHEFVRSHIPEASPPTDALTSELTSWIGTLSHALLTELPLNVHIRHSNELLDVICRARGSSIEIDYQLASILSARSTSSLPMICTRLINHEVAHYLSRQQGNGLVGRDAELAADHFAGWVDGLHKQDPSIGASLFHDLGCTQSKHCKHPPPRLRLEQYLKGHGEGLRGLPHPLCRKRQNQAPLPHSTQKEGQCGTSDGTTHTSSVNQHEPASRPVDGGNSRIELRYFVLRSSFLEQTQRFYSALGLSLKEEQHGAGPLHYAATLGTSVLEFYPITPINRCARIGLGVQSLHETIRRIRLSGFSEAVVRHSAERALLRDPDGNDVELVAAPLLKVLG